MMRLLNQPSRQKKPLNNKFR